MSTTEKQGTKLTVTFPSVIIVILLIASAVLAVSTLVAGDRALGTAPFILISSSVVSKGLNFSKKPKEVKSVLPSMTAFTYALMGVSIIEFVRSTFMGVDTAVGIAPVMFMTIFGFSVLVGVDSALLIRRSEKVNWDDPLKTGRGEFINYAINVVIFSIILFLSPSILWSLNVVGGSITLTLSPLLALAALAYVAVLVFSVGRMFTSSPETDDDDDAVANAVTTVAVPKPTLEGRWGYDRNGLKKDATGHTYGVRKEEEPPEKKRR